MGAMGWGRQATKPTLVMAARHEEAPRVHIERDQGLAGNRADRGLVHHFLLNFRRRRPGYPESHADQPVLLLLRLVMWAVVVGGGGPRWVVAGQGGAQGAVTSHGGRQWAVHALTVSDSWNWSSISSRLFTPGTTHWLTFDRFSSNRSAPPLRSAMLELSEGIVVMVIMLAGSQAAAAAAAAGTSRRATLRSTRTSAPTSEVELAVVATTARYSLLLEIDLAALEVRTDALGCVRARVVVYVGGGGGSSGSGWSLARRRAMGPRTTLVTPCRDEPAAPRTSMSVFLKPSNR